jgi:hypothetical protein
MIGALFAICATTAVLATDSVPQLFKNPTVYVSSAAKSDLYPLISSYFIPEFNRVTGLQLTGQFSGRSTPSENASVSVLLFIDDLLDVHAKTCDTNGFGCAITCGKAGLSSHPEGGSVFMATSDNSSLPASVSDEIRSEFSEFHGHVVVVSGVNRNGVRAAMAVFLRKLRLLHWSSGCVCEVHAPPPWLHLRGHQLTAWAYDFTPFPNAANEYLRELVTFGTNQVSCAAFARAAMTSF